MTKPASANHFVRLVSETTQKSKVVQSTDEALEGVGSDFVLLSGGFGLCGVADTLINAIKQKPEIKNITGVSNNCGLEGKGLSQLLSTGQITKMISSYIGMNKTFEKLYLTGQIDLELTPQGSLAEKVRAGASGIPAFYTPTGVGTYVEKGLLPVRYDETGKKVLKTTKPKETRDFNGKTYLLEEAIYGDVAIVKAYKADTVGNCWFKGSARNFNSVFGRNAKLTIVEAEHIVEPGEIAPEDVHLPGLYVDRVVQSTTPKEFEVLKLKDDKSDGKQTSKSDKELVREKIVRRAAQEFEDGTFANLGVGMPTLAPSFLPPGVSVTLQSENGILGLGPYPTKAEADPDMINAGKETTTLQPGASLFGSEESFAMIRAGKINMSVLGGMQVSAKGDLANWGLPGKVKGMGGAMDLVSNPQNTKVLIVMEHTDKKGNAKILDECTFPVTGLRCVSRLITELAVFDIVDEELVLVEYSPDSSVEEIKEKTEAKFKVSPDLKKIEI